MSAANAYGCRAAFYRAVDHHLGFIGIDGEKLSVHLNAKLFGVPLHFCIGVNLAELFAEIAGENIIGISAR